MSELNAGPYVIGFNGPPRSGKDTIANLLAGQLGRHYSIPVHRGILAAPLRKRMEAITDSDGSDSWYAANKDIQMDYLGGKTPRQIMIEDSEKTLKPQFGYDFWARLYRAKNQHWWGIIPAIVIFSDIGFIDEVKYFVENTSGYLNIRICRTGYDWGNDSRRYVDMCEGASQLPVSNDSYPMAPIHPIMEHIATLGWKL